MFTRRQVGNATAGLVLLAAATAACASGADRGGGAAATIVPATARTDPHVRQPHYYPGESYTYQYDSTSGNYATQQAEGGQVPRATDLQSMSEIRARVRFTIVRRSGQLMKKFELRDVGYRDIAASDTQNGRPAVPFKAIQEVVPGFPADFSYTYPVGGDADVARNINVLFKDYPDIRLFQLVDIFTFPVSADGIPATMGVGQVTTVPAIDVDLLGTTYHSAGQALLFERIDRIDGVGQAYFKDQAMGNYYAAFGIESNVQESFHVLLGGPARGLVSTGELQETTTQGGQAGTPRTVTQRQVSLTLQGPAVQSESAGDR